MANKILAVIRVSTERQETESQKNDVKDFCINKGFKEQDIIFIEAIGASARKLNKKYLEFLETIKNTILADSNIKAVAMWHLNRLGRVEKCILEMKEFFINNKIQVYVKEPSMILLDENGEVNSSAEIIWSVFATMIKQDTAELMHKTERGRKRNREIGKFNGGAYGALYGYMVDDNGFVVPNPQEATQLNDIYKMYASGKYSIRSLVKELNERGWNIRGRKYTDCNLSKQLTNTAYIGYSKTTERKYHPIIDESLWQQVERVRNENNLDISKESKNVHLAIKILKCKHCGHNYVATRDKYTCYQHVMKHRFNEDCINSVSINIDLLDNILWEIAYMKQLDFMQTQSKTEIESLRKYILTLNEKIKTAEKKKNGINAQLKRNAEVYVSGDITIERYNILKSKIIESEKAFDLDIRNYKKEIKATEAKIYQLKYFDLNSFIELGISLHDNTTKKKMKEYVNQHIKEVNIERCNYNGRKAIKIDVQPYDGSEWKYIYQYTIKDKEKQLLFKFHDEYEYYIQPKEERERMMNEEWFKLLNAKSKELYENEQLKARYNKLLKAIENA